MIRETRESVQQIPQIFFFSVVNNGDKMCNCCFLWSSAGLVVHVDKRITLAAFKQNLEPYVGVTTTQFKVFRVYANNQEFESVRLNETLSSFSDDNKVRLNIQNLFI